MGPLNQGEFILVIYNKPKINTSPENQGSRGFGDGEGWRERENVCIYVCGGGRGFSERTSERTSDPQPEVLPMVLFTAVHRGLSSPLCLLSPSLFYSLLLDSLFLCSLLFSLFAVFCLFCLPSLHSLYSLFILAFLWRRIFRIFRSSAGVGETGLQRFNTRTHSRCVVMPD